MQVRTVSTHVSVSTSRRISFRFVRMIAREALSSAYHFELEVEGSAGLDIDRMLGMEVAVRISLQGPIGRYFHGQVEQVSALPGSGKKARYQLVLKPALSALARCSRQRIFSDISLADVIAEVLSTHAIAFDTRYSRNHDPEPVVVQYDESDLNFVFRLMREAGIFFHFEHEDERHLLVLSDSSDAIEPLPGYEMQQMLGPTSDAEGIVRLDPLVSARVARIELDDVDPAAPTLDLGVGVGATRRDGPCETLQEYPGGYSDSQVGLQRARTRLDAIQAGAQSASGEAASRGIAVGHRFDLKGHARKELNGAQVPIRTVTAIDAKTVTAAGPKLVSALMHCSLVTTRHGAPLPLPRAKPQRRLNGPHTACVIGPSGERVHVDEFGRVLVAFPWQADDAVGIWARVAQVWAGQGRGALAIPHIGDEVIVEFEHGDARRPIVVGSLYNGQARPPVALPENKDQTLWRTTSASGAVSELRIDDRDGEQLVSLAAARDLETQVNNDARMRIEGSHHHTVSGAETRIVHGSRSDSVSGGVSGDVGGDLLSTVSGDFTQSVGKQYQLNVAKGFTLTLQDSADVSSAKTLTLSGKKDIVIKNEKASIKLMANGNIEIKGAQVTIEAGGQLLLKGADVIEQEG